MPKRFFYLSMVVAGILVAIAACDLQTSEFKLTPVPTKDAFKLSDGTGVELAWKPTYEDPKTDEEYNIFQVEITTQPSPKGRWIVSRKADLREETFISIGELSPESPKVIDERLEGGLNYIYSFQKKSPAAGETPSEKKIEIVSDITSEGITEQRPDDEPVTIRAYRFFLKRSEEIAPEIVTRRSGLIIICHEFIGHKGAAIHTEKNFEGATFNSPHVPTHPAPVIIRANRARGELTLFPSYDSGLDSDKKELIDYAKEGAQSYQIEIAEHNTMNVTAKFHEGRTFTDSQWLRYLRPSWLSLKGHRFFITGNANLIGDNQVSGLYEETTNALAPDHFRYISPGLGITYRTFIGQSDSGKPAFDINPEETVFLAALQSRRNTGGFPQGKLPVLVIEKDLRETSLLWRKLEEKEFTSQEPQLTLMKLNEAVIKLNRTLGAYHKWADIEISQGRFYFSPSQVELAAELADRPETLVKFMELQNLESVAFVSFTSHEIWRNGSELVIGALAPYAMDELLKNLSNQNPLYRNPPDFGFTRIPVLEPFPGLRIAP